MKSCLCQPSNVSLERWEWYCWKAANSKCRWNSRLSSHVDSGVHYDTCGNGAVSWGCHTFRFHFWSIIKWSARNLLSPQRLNRHGLLVIPGMPTVSVVGWLVQGIRVKSHWTSFCWAESWAASTGSSQHTGRCRSWAVIGKNHYSFSEKMCPLKFRANMAFGTQYVLDKYLLNE